MGKNKYTIVKVESHNKDNNPHTTRVKVDGVPTVFKYTDDGPIEYYPPQARTVESLLAWALPKSTLPTVKHDIKHVINNRAVKRSKNKHANKHAIKHTIKHANKHTNTNKHKMYRHITRRGARGGSRLDARRSKSSCKT